MIVHNVKMISASDLHEAISARHCEKYNIEFSYEQIISVFDKDFWTDGAYLIYFGPDLELETEMEKIVYDFLRESFPEEEFIYIDFSW